jgi:hypothetical protein
MAMHKPASHTGNPVFLSFKLKVFLWLDAKTRIKLIQPPKS